MKRLQDILICLALILSVSGLWSCSEEGGPDTGSTSEAEIVMRLTVSNTSAGSRAPSVPDGGYDRGEGYENYIDVEGRDFRLYFFDGNNRYICPVEVARVYPLESTATSKTYMVHSFGKYPAVKGQVKVVALANWPEYPSEANLVEGVTTIADIAGGRYAFDASKMELSEENKIPLYGVTDKMMLTYDSNNTANIGTIHMLRAYAKVEVDLSPNCVYPIDWVRLSRYNTGGYCAPQGVFSRSEYVYDSYDKDYTSTPSIPDNLEIGEYLPFIKVSDSRWIAYVPEYRNTDRPDTEKSVIEISFRGSDSEVDRLYFATYDLTASPNRPVQHFDVLRNVWYKFTVGKKSPPVVQVVPYNEVDLGPLFGLLTDRELLPIYNDDGTVRYWYDHETGEYFGSDKKTPIDDPYVTVLQPEGWVIIRDLNDRIIGYYDPKDGQYYNTDKKPVPYLDIDAATGWTILRDKDGKVTGYYDAKNDKYYDTDKITEKPSLRDSQ